MTDEQPAVPPVPAPTTVVVEKRWMQWFLEVFFIVLGVVLGFAVAEYGQSRQERELARRVLQALQSEVDHNLTVLEPAFVKHQRWAKGLTDWLNAHAKAGAVPSPGLTARHAFLNTWPDVNLNRPDKIENPFPTLRRVAWDTAVSTGALRLIDYDVAAALSEIYQWQDALPAGAIPSGQVEFFDPAHHIPSTIQTSFAMEALVISEGALLDLYRQHLPAIREAAARAR